MQFSRSGRHPIPGFARFSSEGFESEGLTVKIRPIVVCAALLLLAGCADNGPPGPGVAVNMDYYDGYYDGYYGPFYDGYWGDDGAFYYRDNASSWHRDEGHHFSHVAARGFSHVHGSGAHREH
jgi:hypothetical protein